MTPAQVEEAIRRRYNAVNDSFFAQDEIFKIIYEAETILAIEDKVIEDLDASITTVAGTRAYDFPSNTLEIKRIEYNGQKLEKVDLRDDDQITLWNRTTTTQGTPKYYLTFGEKIYLRDIPDAAQVLSIYRYKLPTLLTTASTTLTVPTYCHTALINYGAMIVALKDQNAAMADRYGAAWESDRKRIQKIAKMRKRGDTFASVKDEESIGTTLIGVV